MDAIAGFAAARGLELAYVSDRPLASNALVVSLERPPSEETVAAAELPEGYRAAVGGSDLIVWLPIAGNLLRTAAGSDRFRKKAGEVVSGLSSSG